MGLLGYGVTSLVTVAFVLYLGNSFYTFYNIFHPAICPKKSPSGSCVHPYFSRRATTDSFPLLGLHIRVSDTNDAFAPSSIEVYKNPEWNVDDGFEFVTEVKLPARARRNGTLYGHVILLMNEYRKDDPQYVEEKLVRTVKLTSYKIPDETAFNLISDATSTSTDDKKSRKPVSRRPVAHLRSKLFVTLVNEDPAYPVRELPSEVIGLMQIERVENNYYYWPLFHVDEMSTRLADLTEIKPDADKVNLTINYRPLSIGKLRLLLMGQASFEQFSKLGFTEKDFDEIKGIFTDTNFYFLLMTVFVSSVHLFFDVLSFKNDISFWKARKTMVGLSTKTLIWRCVSQSIVFLYLLDSKPSMVVLIPFGFGVIVEYWKLTKALKVEWRFPLPRLHATSTTAAEQQTNEYDSEAMGYLSKLMIPLCFAGAVYSLIYLPHKSWYSWVIHSMANGVYAFGFLFMLPQLFLNYKLKSVAHLPWRAFMYKAFNTFIDDIFAFIITMPTAHRLACFRDDIVFLIYLYQRYLYPVDKTRVNEFGEAFDDEPTKEPKPEEKKEQ